MRRFESGSSARENKLRVSDRLGNKVKRPSRSEESLRLHGDGKSDRWCAPTRTVRCSEPGSGATVMEGKMTRRRRQDSSLPEGMKRQDWWWYLRLPT
ncbi:unnamed protein product [Ascophyllum nodosum]